MALRVPDEVLRALPERVALADIEAYAPVGAAPGTSLGETHIVLARGRTWALTRISPWDTLESLELDGRLAPSIQSKDYETWLSLPTADGRDARVPLTSFDIEGVTAYLEAAGHSATPEPVAPEAPPAAAPPKVEHVRIEAPLSNKAFDLRLEEAFERLEDIGARAGRRGSLNALKVTATIANGPDSVALEVHWDRAALSRLAALAEAKDG